MEPFCRKYENNAIMILIMCGNKEKFQKTGIKSQLLIFIEPGPADITGNYRNVSPLSAHQIFMLIFSKQIKRSSKKLDKGLGGFKEGRSRTVEIVSLNEI
jgi:hypothetical protein